MANIERVTVVFPEQMADEIRAAVEKGEYASTSEVVRDAIRLWTDRRDLRARERALLRRAWDEGKKSGSAGSYDMRGILKDARARKPKGAKRKP
ncbi:MAG TPA: type II toxin-antitoxin system ParD family antitoxin [Rhizomicrobium sp.]|jgi:antitoxin ParD1/3/4|nr:type II toxin-antitoxin system ParD family antitoxin [Rhizomicrobium sp.]